MSDEIPPSEDENPPLSEEGSGVDRCQRPMEVRRSRYYETGRLDIAEGPLGKLPEVVGGAPPGVDTWLTEKNFVCNAAPGRKRCRYYGALLLEAEGMAKGFAPMEEIRRFCRRLGTASELMELDRPVLGCFLRRPRDEASEARVDAFEARQRKMGEEASESTGTLEF